METKPIDQRRIANRGLIWAVFISGHGSNLQALLDAEPKIQIGLVVSSKADALGIERAHRAGVPVIILPKDIPWNDLSAELKKRNIDRIFLAGFMRMIPASFVEAWSEKILNLHPSLLPNYKGLRAIERSYEDGAAMGVTIHWVTPELDGGPILIQQEVLSQEFVRKLSFEDAREKLRQVENELVVAAVRRCEEC